MHLSFFRSGDRLTNDYSQVGPILHAAVAQVNPHFKLVMDDYWNMTETELLSMVEDFKAYNQRVNREIKKGSRG